jgi:hypothetical protein
MMKFERLFLAGALAALSPLWIPVAAKLWTHNAEWARLAVAETYGKLVQKRMEEMGAQDLRNTLDQYGVEALDELEAAIRRREESRRAEAEGDA